MNGKSFSIQRSVAEKEAEFFQEMAEVVLREAGMLVDQVENTKFNDLIDLHTFILDRADREIDLVAKRNKQEGGV